jgi:hypothetical protein
MNSRLEDQLRTAFEQASDFVQPRQGLEQRVRLVARRRRILTAAIASATAVMVIAAGSFALANAPTAGHHQSTGAAAPVRVHLPAHTDLLDVAVSSRYVYVLTSGPTTSVAAYERATSQLVRRVNIPASNANLYLGPGDMVWVSFVPPFNALAMVVKLRPAQVWLLNADLRLRSTGSIADPRILVPTGETTAWTMSQRGLMAIDMPLPGTHGRGTQTLESGTGIGPSPTTEPDGWAGVLNGRVAVLVLDRSVGGRTGVVIAGHPSVSFGGKRSDVVSLTSTGSSLWVVTEPIPDVAFPPYGQLVRLNSQLKPTTPAFIRISPVFASTYSAWYAGSVLWIFPMGKHRLYCIPARNPAGQPVAVTLPGHLVAVSHHTAFITIQRGSSLTIAALPVPAACR